MESWAGSRLIPLKFNEFAVLGTFGKLRLLLLLICRECKVTSFTSHSQIFCDISYGLIVFSFVSAYILSHNHITRCAVTLAEDVNAPLGRRKPAAVKGIAFTTFQNPFYAYTTPSVRLLLHNLNLFENSIVVVITSINSYFHSFIEMPEGVTI